MGEGVKREGSGNPSGVSRRELMGAGAALGLLGMASSALAQDLPRNARGSRRTLLQGGLVLTMDPALGDFKKADVLMEDGKIAAVGQHLDARGGDVVDASGMIVMPGFVDTHRHMWQGLIRNIGPDDLLPDYLTNVLFGFAPILTPDEVYLGDLISAYSAMNAGITTLLDWSHIATTTEHTDAAIEALRDSGVRGVYAYGPNFGVTPPWYENPNQPYPGDIYRLRQQYFSSSDQLLTLALAAAGPEFSNVDAAVIEWQTARDVGARISVHIGVGTLGQQGLLQQLASRVQLADDTTYIHACTLSDTDWELIAQTGGAVSLAVPIELQMGHGRPPLQKALDFGVPVSLSVDVETNMPTDMFTQMHAAFAVQRGYLNEQHLFPDVSHRAQLLTARRVLEFATIGGANINGLGAKIGSLTPGKQADVVLLQARAINVAPINDAVGAVVLGMDSSNVDSVFVAGKPVKWRGKLVNVDVPRLLTRAEKARLELMRRAGVSPDPA
jgi:5-methylthioadenosine/S-adenosylhomocysteine deaminase